MGTNEAVPAPGGDTGTRHVRVRVEMVLAVEDPDEVVRAAWSRIEAEEQMPAEEREQAARDVAQATAEAVAYLVDPVDMVGDMPGVVLAQASWSSELTHHDPDQPWDDDPDPDDPDEEPFDPDEDPAEPGDPEDPGDQHRPRDGGR